MSTDQVAVVGDSSVVISNAAEEAKQRALAIAASLSGGSSEQSTVLSTATSELKRPHSSSSSSSVGAFELKRRALTAPTDSDATRPERISVPVPTDVAAACDWRDVLAQVAPAIVAASELSGVAVFVSGDAAAGDLTVTVAAPASDAAAPALARARAEVEALFSDVSKRDAAAAAAADAKRADAALAAAAGAPASGEDADVEGERDAKRARPAAGTAADAATAEEEPLVELPQGLYAADVRDTRASEFFKRSIQAQEQQQQQQHGQQGQFGYGQQPAHHGHGHGGPGLGAGSDGPGDFIEIPNEKVGLVIGRAGETIRMLQSMTGAQINVARECDPGSVMRRVTLVGAPEAVAYARTEIDRLVNRRPATSVDPITGSVQVAPGAQSEVMSVPAQCVGVIIGRKGETIRAIQLKSGATVQTQQSADAAPGATHRDVTLVGTADQIAAARQEIQLLVQNTEAPGSVPANQLISGMGRREERAFVMYIPHPTVGLVIGRGGASIRDIQEQTGVRLTISRDEATPQREVKITGGSHDGVMRAKAMVEGIVAQHYQGVGQGGPAAGHFGGPRGGAGPIAYGAPAYGAPMSYGYDAYGQMPVHAYGQQQPVGGYGGYSQQQPVGGYGQQHGGYGQQQQHYGGQGGYQQHGQQQQQQQQAAGAAGSGPGGAYTLADLESYYMSQGYGAEESRRFAQQYIDQPAAPQHAHQ